MFKAINGNNVLTHTTPKGIVGKVQKAMHNYAWNNNIVFTEDIDWGNGKITFRHNRKVFTWAIMEE